MTLNVSVLILTEHSLNCFIFLILNFIRDCNSLFINISCTGNFYIYNKIEIDPLR
ncbi:hypothetical protein C2G38_2101111 [Gigaspora rosea]|uniref:Uncharacterized protein n=1 Tax=Gigaspora rosea TaxID=44941 RepID=A0A397URZ0_9GLOM|nr:hypothetical protein C2G38_2101111 [Gigaspora rosea]